MSVRGKNFGIEVVSQPAAGFYHEAAVTAEAVVFNYYGTARRQILAIAKSQNLKGANNVVGPGEIFLVAASSTDFDRDSVATFENKFAVTWVRVIRAIKSSEGRGPANTIWGE